MKKRILAAMLAALALSTAIILSHKPAAAATKLLDKSGAWEAYIATTRPNDTVACGMSVSSSDGNRQIHVKWFHGYDHMTVHVFKNSWRIPEGTKVRVVLGFDGGVFGNGEATAYKAANGWSYLAFNIEKDDLIKDFIGEFREANKMWISFPDGNEAPWDAAMIGSRKIASSWIGCIDEVRKYATKPTQPYSNVQPTQPNAPTQPSTPTQPYDMERKPTMQTQPKERGA